MIVPMKKIYLVLQKKYCEKALTNLRDIAAVHVEHVQEPGGHHIQELRERVGKMARALEVLAPHAGQPQKEIPKGKNIADEIIDNLAQQDTLQDDMAKHQSMIALWEPWGSFEPKDIEQLERSDLYVRLLEIPEKDIGALPGDAAVEILKKRGPVNDCMVVTRGKKDLPFRETLPPPISLNEMKDQLGKEEKRLMELGERIKACGQYSEHLKKIHAASREELEFEEIKGGIGDAEQLVYLKGYLPTERVEALTSLARREHWGLMVEDPQEEDKVPTLLKNPEWVNIIKPAFSLIEIVPGYREVDVSPVFLVFFTLFFGMLIGDAAYGFIFLLAAIAAHIKMKDKVDPKVFYLAYLLTGFTCIWGVLTGTYFGQEWLPSTVKALAPWLNSNENIQWLCFTVALAHLSIARLWTIKVKLPDITALSHIGWLLIVWGMYFLANMFVLDRPFPDFAKLFFLIGIPLALFFMVPFKDFTKKVPEQIIPFVLSVISAGTDIISYIRLFAVGLATVAVADAANFMPEALPAGVGHFFLVVLHSINMVLAIMAILVHAIRLNVLEFSGHLGLEWSGTKYSPFKLVKNG